MNNKGGRRPLSKNGVTRSTATFPAEIYKTLAELAESKKVSVAWVIREAAEKYVAEQVSEQGKNKA